MDQGTKAAVYCRVASANAPGIEGQKNRLLRYAQDSGFTVHRVYEDNGFSGLSLDRPAFSEMVQDIANGVVQVVLAADVSRITRNPVDFVNWMAGLEQLRCQLVTIH